MFWKSSAPTVEDIQNHIDELHSRALQLDKALERAPSMNYFDAMWIARAVYRLGAYLGTCTNDTRNVPDPIDPSKANVVLEKVQSMTPLVITACDRAGKARGDFERLLVLSVVKVQLRWLASHQREFADTLVGRAPAEVKGEGQRIAQKLTGTFDKLLAVYDINLQGPPPPAQAV